MTTERFNGQASATARAMALAYEQAQAGARSGQLRCPKCSGALRFKADPAKPHDTSGACSTARCVRWPL